MGIFDTIHRMMSYLFRRDGESPSGLLAAAGGGDTGVAVTRETAMEVATVMAAVNCIVQDIGQIPLELWDERTTAAGNVVQHRATWAQEYRLFAQGPNSYQTAQQWREHVAYHTLIWGDYYAHKRYVGGYIDELHPVEDPSRVQVKLEDGHRQYTLLSAAAGLEKGTYGDETIFHVAGPSPDGYRGRDIATTHRQTLGLALALLQYGSTFFFNGAMPGGILVMGQGTTDAQAREAADLFEQRYGGRNRGRIAAFRFGTEFKTISTDPEKSQALESKRQSAEDLAAALRVPEWRIRQQTPPSHQAWRDYVVFTLGPLMERIRAASEKGLLARPAGPPAPRLYLYWDYERLLEMDFPAQIAAYKQAIDARILNPNEVRERLGYNPYDSGDAFVNPYTTRFDDPNTQGGG